ncbi:MAG: YraN family protein [Firmicutes bacterium]|nr:YraN family protein [Bacillota bacterium]
MNKTKLGQYGQNKALEFLCKKGLKLLASNFKIIGGEIDLIMQDNDCFVFVEVKYRRSVNYGLPRESVTPQKQQRIKLTAMHYLEKFVLTKTAIEPAMRFDVVEVLEIGNRLEISHIEDAF